MQAYFTVTAPTVHDMVLRLEASGLVARAPGEARSITLLLLSSDLPALE